MGRGLKREPDLMTVLDSLFSDASYDCYSFEEFADNLGYDQDSRKAYRIWQAVKRQSAKFRRLLGDDFDALNGAYEEIRDSL